MNTLENFWEEIWGEPLSNIELHNRSFRILHDLLKAIEKDKDEEFIREALSKSRSINIVIKKLYYSYAPIEKKPVENPKLINPLELPKIDIKNGKDFEKVLDKEYLVALEHNELNKMICKNCGGENNFKEDFDRYEKPILVCIEDDCSQVYGYDKENQYQLKIPLHWLGLKYQVYNENTSGFEDWVKKQVEQFITKDDLETIEYDESGKILKNYWDNIEENPNLETNLIINNDHGLEVFNKGGHWYYWVNGFKTFRFHPIHKDRNFDDINDCRNCGICKMDV